MILLGNRKNVSLMNIVKISACAENYAFSAIERNSIRRIGRENAQFHHRAKTS
jgi:hypothetical protein